MANPKTIRLARLPTGWREQPQLLERYWDESMTAIEKTLNAILAIPAIQAALADVNAAVQEAKDAAAAAQAAADGAGSSAGDAQAAADAQKKESSIVQSYPSGYTEPLISATSGGLITIKNHTRVYGDMTLNPSVLVIGGTLTGTGSPGDVVRVYYVDSSRGGGSVTYQYTVDPATFPAQGGDTHSVGAVVIPDTGTKPGNGVRPPGYVNPIVNLE